MVLTVNLVVVVAKRVAWVASQKLVKVYVLVSRRRWWMTGGCGGIESGNHEGCVHTSSCNIHTASCNITRCRISSRSNSNHSSRGGDNGGHGGGGGVLGVVVPCCHQERLTLKLIRSDSVDKDSGARTYRKNKECLNRVFRNGGFQDDVRSHTNASSSRTVCVHACMFAFLYYRKAKSSC